MTNDAPAYGSNRWFEFSSSRVEMVLPSAPEIHRVFDALDNGTLTLPQGINRSNRVTCDRIEVFFGKDPFSRESCECDTDYLIKSNGKTVPKLRTFDVLDFDKNMGGFPYIFGYRKDNGGASEWMTCPLCGTACDIPDYRVIEDPSNMFPSKNMVGDYANPLTMSLMSSNSSSKKGIKNLLDGAGNENIYEEVTLAINTFDREVWDALQYIKPTFYKHWKMVLETNGVDKAYSFSTTILPLLMGHKTITEKNLSMAIEVMAAVTHGEIRENIENGVTLEALHNARVVNDIDRSLFEVFRTSGEFLAMSAA